MSILSHELRTIVDEAVVRLRRSAALHGGMSPFPRRGLHPAGKIGDSLDGRASPARPIDSPAWFAPEAPPVTSTWIASEVENER